MDKSCAICGHTDDLYILEIPVDDDITGEKESKFVCGNCWNIIAQISLNVINHMKKNGEI